MYVRRGAQRAGYYHISGLSHRVPALYPGEVVSIKSIYFGRPCWIKVSATADSGRAMPESDEADNAARVELRRRNW